MIELNIKLNDDCRDIAMSKITSDDIIRMARESGKYADNEFMRPITNGGWHQIRDERFAALVADAQRDIDAKLADETHPHDWPFIAAAIRANKD